MSSLAFLVSLTLACCAATAAPLHAVPFTQPQRAGFSPCDLAPASCHNVDGYQYYTDPGPLTYPIHMYCDRNVTLEFVSVSMSDGNTFVSADPPVYREFRDYPGCFAAYANVTVNLLYNTPVNINYRTNRLGKNVTNITVQDSATVCRYHDPKCIFTCCTTADVWKSLGVDSVSEGPCDPASCCCVQSFYTYASGQDLTVTMSGTMNGNCTYHDQPIYSRLPLQAGDSVYGELNLMSKDVYNITLTGNAAMPWTIVNMNNPNCSGFMATVVPPPSPPPPPPPSSDDRKLIIGLAVAGPIFGLIIFLIAYKYCRGGSAHGDEAHSTDSGYAPAAEPYRQIQQGEEGFSYVYRPAE